MYFSTNSSYIHILNALSQSISSDECLKCHSDPDLTKTVDDTVEVSLFIDNEKFSNSVHGGFECVDLHLDIPEIPHEENLKHPNCNQCHDDVAEEYLKSFHGQGLLEGDADAPYCWDCHSSHYVYSKDDTLSTIHLTKETETCARCHADPRIVKKYHISIAQPCEAYKTNDSF